MKTNIVQSVDEARHQARNEQLVKQNYHKKSNKKNHSRDHSTVNTLDQMMTTNSLTR